MSLETSSKKQVFEKALCAWGWDIQSLVLVEKMAELSKEIIKIHRNIFFEKPSCFDAMICEIADVQLMIDQLKYELTDDDLDLYQREYGLALDRIRKRLEEGSEK